MPFKDPEVARAKQREYDATRRKRRKNGSGYPVWREKENDRQRQWNAKRRKESVGRPMPDHCDACGGNDGGIVFDHCHTLGHPRGWLCRRCNLTLGHVNDDPGRLRKLIAYLERTKDGTEAQLALLGV